MCERSSDSTTLPPTLAEFLAERRAQEANPDDDSLGYRITAEGLQALADYEQRHGRTLVRNLPLPDTVAEALATEEWHEERRQRRKEVRDRGNRIVTVCGRYRNRRKVPDLRLMGQWLEQAGFDLGRQCEVEVEPGTLTIRAL